ncbi:MAG: glycosyltransferase, partial [Bacteroidota bacterium]
PLSNLFRSYSAHHWLSNHKLLLATRGTLAEIKNLEHENVLVYNVNENCGKAKAVQLGAMHLYNTTDVTTIGFIDADLSTDFHDYDRLVYQMKVNESLKVIYGSRASDGQNKIERDLIRGIISKGIRYIILCITRLNIEDTQCGAKVFRREIMPDIFNSDFKTRWLFDVEILLRLKRKFTLTQFREIFMEKPLENWVHMDGSKLGMKDAIKIPLSLLRIGWIYNILYPIKKTLYEPLKAVFRLVKDSTTFKVSMSFLGIISMLLLVAGQLYDGLGVFGFCMLIFTFTYFVKTLFTGLKALVKNNWNKKWLWIKAYINTYKRKTWYDEVLK